MSKCIWFNECVYNNECDCCDYEDDIINSYIAREEFYKEWFEYIEEVNND